MALRFSIHTLVFYGLDSLRLMVENTGGFVEKIYLSHSKKPWNAYNKDAPEMYQSSVDISLIADFPYKEKLVWLEGE